MAFKPFVFTPKTKPPGEPRDPNPWVKFYLQGKVVVAGFSRTALSQFGLVKGARYRLYFDDATQRVGFLADDEGNVLTGNGVISVERFYTAHLSTLPLPCKMYLKQNPKTGMIYCSLPTELTVPKRERHMATPPAKRRQGRPRKDATVAV